MTVHSTEPDANRTGWYVASGFVGGLGFLIILIGGSLAWTMRQDVKKKAHKYF